MIAVRLRNWARYRDIVWYRTIAGLKSEARQNFLGYIWFLLEPALTTAIMYAVYVLIFQSRGASSVVLLLVGTIIWQWFESSVVVGMMGIKAKLHIMSHFTLPKYIFPLVGIFTNTWKFLCVFLVLLTFCAICGYPPNLQFFWLPLVMAVQLTLIIGLALPLAIAVAYFNDLTTITNSIFRLLMFVSGVFFTADMVRTQAPKALPYFYSNPMAGLIESYRNIVMNHRPPNFHALVYALCCGLVLCLLGLVWSRHIDGKILKRANG